MRFMFNLDHKPPSNRFSLAIHTSLLILTLLIVMQLTRSMVMVNIEMSASAAGTMTLNWRDNASQYSTFNSKSTAIKRGHQSHFFILWTLGDIKKLAIKPIDKQASITLNNIVIRSLGYEPIAYNTHQQFEKFKALNDIADINIVDNQLNLHTLGKDAQLEFDVIHPQINTKNAVLIDKINIKIVFILLVVLIILGIYYPLIDVAVVILSVMVGVIYMDDFPANYAVINIELESAENDQLVVYWAAEHTPYTEQNSRRIETRKGIYNYRLSMANLNTIQHIRIDPIQTIGKAIIKQISISAFTFEPIFLNAKNNFYAVDFSKTKHVKATRDALEFAADTNDDFFELSLNVEPFRADFLLKSYLVFVVFLLLLRVGVFVLKKDRSTNIQSVDRNSFKIGMLIAIVMLLQLMLAHSYGFFIDYQANELVITTAGEKALSMSSATKTHDIAHIGLLNFAYAMVIILALLILSVFSKMIHVIYLSAFLILCGVIGYAIKDKDTLIHIEMETSVANRLKVYWADEAELYKEQHSASVDTAIGRHIYTLSMANLNNLHNIRIEPINTEGHAAISSIEINEAGYAPIRLNAQNHFYLADRVLKTKSTNKETTEQLAVEQDKLIFTTTGNDRFFELIVEPDAFKAPYRLRFYAQFVLLLAGVAGGLYWANRRFGFFNSDSTIIIIRLCGIIVAVMVLQMAWLSDYDVHPDEKAHIDSIDYYTQYSDPPVLGDVRSLNTYQYPWGVSRLDDLGVSYFLMGKLKNIITYYAEDTVFTSRVFNSLLMIGLVCCTRHKRFALFLIPLFCLPQVWHLFSYANRDGFALFLAILLGWQLVNPTSYLNHYVNGQTKSMQWRNILLPTLLLGLLSIEISNYIIFILYFVAILLWQGLFSTVPRKQFFVRCLVLVLLAGSLYGVRKSVDIAQNGFNKQAQKIAYAENIAAPDFKPSVAVTDKGYFGLRLQQRGVDALTLFNPRWEWQTLTFKSFAGLYGNQFAELSPEWYYSFVTYLYCLVAVILMITVVRYGHFKYWLLTGLTLVFVFGDILMGFLYSWTYDFQPQGRYIFPLIPMLMIYLFNVAPLMSNKSKAMLFACGVLLFVLSLFSFRLIALTYLIS